MATEQVREDIEFKTLDGLTLRGWLYKGLKGGPAIIVNVAVRRLETSCPETPAKQLRLSLTLV